MEAAEDIRFNHVLAAACGPDKVHWCRHVPPEQGRALSCLEEHSRLPDFGDECKAALETNALNRVADARLDYRLRTLCRNDVQVGVLESGGANVMGCCRHQCALWELCSVPCWAAAVACGMQQEPGRWQQKMRCGMCTALCVKRKAQHSYRTLVPTSVAPLHCLPSLPAPCRCCAQQRTQICWMTWPSQQALRRTC